MKKSQTSKIIKFKAENEYVWNVGSKPEPASSFLPKWYRDAPVHINDEKFKLDPGPNVTFKRCFPIFDSINSGYIIPLWADTNITYNEIEGTVISWGTTMPVFGIWSKDTVSTFEVPEGFDNQVFKYIHGWIPKTPPGYSTLVTHPFGYQNLPFRSITGIIDTDKLDTGAQVPLMFKKGWEGILEKGTPMFQMIPFKRDNWQSDFELMKENENFYNVEKLHSKLVSSYGKFLRAKKIYK